MSLVYPLALLALIIIVPLFLWLDQRWNKEYIIRREYFAEVNFIDRYWPISAKAPRIMGQLLWISALVMLVMATAHWLHRS